LTETTSKNYVKNVVVFKKGGIVMKEVEVCLNGTDWIPVNANCVDYIYSDELQVLLVICDELAELTQHSGMKSAEAKEEDALKDEIVSILSSIAQLGRSAGIHISIATQKPKADIVPTVLRSNPLSLDTLVEIEE
jgi:DNA segregation ATPase FtsK/SpoIIIE-like protein